MDQSKTETIELKMYQSKTETIELDKLGVLSLRIFRRGGTSHLLNFAEQNYNKSFLTKEPPA
jgi:hypothetical protein